MKKILALGVLVLSIFLLNSCQKKFIVEPQVNPIDSISFSQQIIPIWADQSCTGCHSSTGQQPDLTADKAYQEITSMGLVLTNDAAKSKIYEYPLASGNHFAKYTSAQAALVLQWIEEGALDN
ncbi:MAG: hypothetical protein B7C24_04625 [Bacteroidetes bacterium 4572_77]|nr:MAG: hypothetical protein B7C24_04625 [Bacteroidetes bacterium 4572_77]